MILNDNAIIFHIDVNSAYLSWSALRELQNGSNTGFAHDSIHCRWRSGNPPWNRRCEIHSGKSLWNLDGGNRCQCISKMSDTCDGSTGSHLLPGNESETDASSAQYL